MKPWSQTGSSSGTDYPYEEMKDCMDFLERVKIPEGDKEKIYSLNAKRIGIFS